MKYEITLNLYWAIVWAVVLIGAIVAIFWEPAIYIVVAIAVAMFIMFIRECIRYARMK